MTLTELRNEVYALLGNPSDLDPTDTATDGGRDTLDIYLNAAYRRVTTYRFRDGHQVRFRALKKVGYFQTFLYTSTAGFSTGSTTTATLDSSAGADNDRYNGFVLKPTSGDESGNARLIVDYDGASKVATVHKAWDDGPAAADTYKLYKRFNRLLASSHDFVGDHISLDPASEVFAVTRITDLEEGQRLTYGLRTRNYPSRMTQDGPASAWWENGDRIEFDTAYSTQRWYMLEYVSYAESLTGDGTQVPVIPVSWHEAIMLAAVWRGWLRLQETEMAAAAKADWHEAMMSLRQEEEASFGYADGQMVMEF